MEINYDALKTTCGAIYYILNRYGDKEISPYDWSYVTGSFSIPSGTLYCIEELNKEGFVISTPVLKFRYVHHDFGDRKIELL